MLDLVHVIAFRELKRVALTRDNERVLSSPFRTLGNEIPIETVEHSFRFFVTLVVAVAILAIQVRVHEHATTHDDGAARVNRENTHLFAMKLYFVDLTHDDSES